jgi:hypothetical protein
MAGFGCPPRPRFTGEASLYQTNAHYRTGSHVIHSSAERVNPIYSAMEIPEVIMSPGLTHAVMKIGYPGREPWLGDVAEMWHYESAKSVT